jgi:integrase/recombinase XerD
MLSANPMSQPDAWRMIRRRAAAAGIVAEIGCHSFRANGITVYLLNGGLLEYAQQMAAHESARTTKLYDRRSDQVTLDQVERIIVAERDDTGTGMQRHPRRTDDHHRL